MTRINPIPHVALVALALTACQQDNPDNFAIDGDNGAAAAIETLPPNDPASNIAEADNGADLPLNQAAPGATTIPAQYQGRWGLVAADCTSTRGDAKGLITINDRTIRFYEATATLREQRPAIATSFSGLYDFTGEGQRWERVETLTRTGDRLERRSTDPRGAAGDALTYRRCS